MLDTEASVLVLLIHLLKKQIFSFDRWSQQFHSNWRCMYFLSWHSVHWKKLPWCIVPVHNRFLNTLCFSPRTCHYSNSELQNKREN